MQSSEVLLGLDVEVNGVETEEILEQVEIGEDSGEKLAVIVAGLVGDEAAIEGISPASGR